MNLDTLLTLPARRYWLATPILLLALYLLTLPRTVTFEDDGLFLMAGYFSGIAHPPGYPLYSLLAAPAGLLPIDMVPAGLHALSALSGALACLLLAGIMRRLFAPDLLAVLAALACGCSAVFWSQAIIAEVYTLNALLVFSLVALALRTDLRVDTGNESQRLRQDARLDGLAAVLLGLALTLHWPLVALSIPALAVLFWPGRHRLAADFLRLLMLFAVGLSPYLWMVIRSHSDVPINFYGPITSLQDFWFILSRQGYVSVDVSGTSGLPDKIGYTLFLAREIATQYTLPGFLLVLWGFAAQWRVLPRRISTAFTILFICHSAAFLLLIHFEYDDLSRSAFRVYPLVAYAVMAIWLALGLHVLSATVTGRFNRKGLGPALACTAGVLILTLQLVQNLQLNDRHEFTEGRDYARALLDSLPPNAELFVSGDIATFVPGYAHHVESLRPDVTLYSLDGIVFSNRLFHPHRTQAALRLEIFNHHVQHTQRPVCTTEGLAATVGQIDHWLFTCIDRNAPPGAFRIAFDTLPGGYYRQVVLQRNHPDAWTRFHHSRLLRRAGYLSGRAELQEGAGAIAADTLPPLYDDFHFVLGYLDGTLSGDETRLSVKHLVETVNRIERLPDGAKKKDVGRFLALRGRVAELAGDEPAARELYEESLDKWPDTSNNAAERLLVIYAAQGDAANHERIRGRYRPSQDAYRALN